jgi:hypothetical protein
MEDISPAIFGLALYLPRILTISRDSASKKEIPVELC